MMAKEVKNTIIQSIGVVMVSIKAKLCLNLYKRTAGTKKTTIV